jgi:uncharacterized protein YebE (UPF0316 family)
MATLAIVLPTLAESAWLPLIIFLARVADVSMGTVRMIAVTRGQRLLAVVLAFFEILIWVTAISTVFSHLDNWLNVLGFAAGFATGNAVGMGLERRIALGMQMITFLSCGRSQAVAERLKFNDLEVTTFEANGRRGPVAMCVIVVPRKLTESVIRMAKEIDPEVLTTVEDVRESTVLQPHFHTPGKLPASPARFHLLRRRLTPPEPEPYRNTELNVRSTAA